MVVVDLSLEEVTRERSAVFALGACAGVVAMSMWNHEKTRADIEYLYSEIHLQNMLKVCGTVWLVTATYSWCIYCLHETAPLTF